MIVSGGMVNVLVTFHMSLTVSTTLNVPGPV